MTLPQPTGMRLLPRSPYCLSSEGESRLAVASYFVLPPFYEARRHLGSRSLTTRPCRNHASPQGAEPMSGGRVSYTSPRTLPVVAGGYLRRERVPAASGARSSVAPASSDVAGATSAGASSG